MEAETKWPLITWPQMNFLEWRYVNLDWDSDFIWSLLPMVQLPKFQHRFSWWLGSGQATGHYLNQWWLAYWRIYASHGLSLNELMLYIYTYIYYVYIYVHIAICMLQATSVSMQTKTESFTCRRNLHILKKIVPYSKSLRSFIFCNWYVS